MATSFTDTFPQTAGTTLVGNAASDGSIYTSRQGNVKLGTANDVYPSGPGWGEVLAGNAPNHSDYPLNFSIVSTASGANGSQTTLLLHCDTAGGASSAQLRVRFIDANTTTYTVLLEELTGINNITNSASVSGGMTFARNSTTALIARVKGRVFTLATAAAPNTPLATLNLTFNFLPGKVGFGGYNNGGATTDTAGLHIAAVSFTLDASTPTAYALIAPVSVWDAATAGSGAENLNIAAGHPCTFNIAGGSFTNPGGYGDVGYFFNGRYKITLNGGVLATAFNWTPATGIALGASVVAGAVQIPAGQTYAYFDWYCPASTPAGSYNLTGTNDAGFADPTLTLSVKLNFVIDCGDSNANPVFLPNWLLKVNAAHSSNTKFYCCAVAGYKLTDLLTLIATTTTPWYSASRGGRQKVVISCGNNDIEVDLASSATALSRFASVVAALKTGGWAGNIIAFPCPSRNSARTPAVFWPIASAFNSGLNTAYGPDGADKSVYILPYANDPRICAQTAYSDTNYFSDGVHHTGPYGIAVFSGWVMTAISMPSTLLSAVKRLLTRRGRN